MRSDVADSSKYIGYFQPICVDVKDLSKFIYYFSTNLRRRSDVADSSIFIGYFSSNMQSRCDVTDSLKFICHFLTILRRQICVKIYLLFLTNLWRRRRFVIIYWSFLDQYATSQRFFRLFMIH